MNTMTVPACAEYLRDKDRLLILTHRNPDGDTIGCAAALCRALRAMGRQAFVLENPGFTARYAPYLDGLCTAEYAPDCVISVDVADAKLLPDNAAAYAPDLAIDHHATHRGFARRLLLEADAAACGEVVYKLIRELDIPASPDIATALYIAISTDTGCFLHSGTTPATHRIAAELISQGVDISSIHREFFVVKTRARLAVESGLIEGMHFYFGGRCAVMRLPLSLIEQTRATEDDLDNISALARSIQGVELGVLIREMADGSSKISMRSGEAVSAADVCARFSGGGHARAAGCTIHAPCGAAEELICAEISRMQIF